MIPILMRAAFFFCHNVISTSSKQVGFPSAFFPAAFPTRAPTKPARGIPVDAPIMRPIAEPFCAIFCALRYCAYPKPTPMKGSASPATSSASELASSAAPATSTPTAAAPAPDSNRSKASPAVDKSLATFMALTAPFAALAPWRHLLNFSNLPFGGFGSTLITGCM